MRCYANVHKDSIQRKATDKLINSGLFQCSQETRGIYDTEQISRAVYRVSPSCYFHSPKSVLVLQIPTQLVLGC